MLTLEVSESVPVTVDVVWKDGDLIKSSLMTPLDPVARRVGYT